MLQKRQERSEDRRRQEVFEQEIVNYTLYLKTNIKDYVHYY